MGGFFGWFLVVVLVLAVFNAEKLPALKKMLEEKFKDSVDVAKEGSKLAKDKIKKIREENLSKRTDSNKPKEVEENTPEEIEDALQFMGGYLDKKKPSKDEVHAQKKEDSEKKTAEQEVVKKQEDEPVDLDQNYK